MGRWMWVVCLLLSWTADVVAQRETPFEATLEEVLNWSHPLDLTPERFEKKWAREGFETSPLVAFSESGERLAAQFGERPYTNVRVQLTALVGKARVERGRAWFRENHAEEIELAFVPNARLDEAIQTVWNRETAKTIRVEISDPTTVLFQSGELGDASAVWIHGKGLQPTLRIVSREKIAAAQYCQLPDGLVLAVDFDFLMNHAAIWTLTPEQLDQRFESPAFDQQPFFKWLTSQHDRARFTRRPFGNVRVGLSLLSGKVAAEEVLLDFEGGVLKRATASIYNRGDAGPMTKEAFERLIAQCGKEIGQQLQVTPKRQTQPQGSALKNVGWIWSAAGADVLMEHNDLTAATKSAAVVPEYLRIKIAPSNNRDWSMGVSTLGRSTSTLTKRDLLRRVVKIGKTGARIEGVPMVDQGEKGYCVLASFQRLFEFYQIPCDQHELAQLLGSSPESGTSGEAIERRIGALDRRFETRFQVLIGRTMNPKDAEKLDAKRFARMVKTQIDRGMPLLWAMRLGIADEDPPLPRRGQISGGHMRMIIGYDEEADQILFTDSWGAGHELKRMKTADAFRSTDGLFVVQPKN